jgi:GT2 family glycosyltransferase
LQSNDFFGKYDIYLIKSKFNHGFAAGNNIGIKFSQSFLSCNIFWLLNNDAIPQKDAFKCLKSVYNTPNAPSICGTSILDYHNPKKVQSCGGLFNFYTGMASHKFDGCTLDLLNRQPELVFSTYPVGASLVVHEDFIFSSGYMNEELFLYYEELDWMIKSCGPIQCPISTRSRIFHKGSSSTGFSQNLRDRNASADYYIIRNRLLIAHQIGTTKLIIFAAATLVGLFKRLISGRTELFFGGVVAMFDGLRGRGGRR